MLTVAQAAEELSLSPRQVRTLIGQGRIQAQQVNAGEYRRFLLIPAAEVARYRQEHGGSGRRRAPKKSPADG